MKPLRFEPVSYDYLWGRELWLLSPIAGKESLCNGKPLSAYIAEYKERLLGKRSIRLYGERFPLLIKDIKSRQQLSVQVHPDDQMAHTKGLPNGKSEMWLVKEVCGADLASRVDKGYEDDANQIIVGLNNHLTLKEFETIVRQSVESPDVELAEQRLESQLRSYKAQKGDCFYIPAGVVHSIGAGLNILEIQQASDTTYRLYDFNRTDKNGQKRELHIEDALCAMGKNGEISALNFTEKCNNYCNNNSISSNNNTCVDSHSEQQRRIFSAPLNCYSSKSAIVELVRSTHFTANLINFNNFCRPKCGAENFYHIDYSRYGSFSIIVCIEGSGKLLYNSSSEEYINKGDLLLLPAELSSADIYSTSSLQLVEIHI